jgi:hypothetical protein
MHAKRWRCSINQLGLGEAMRSPEASLFYRLDTTDDADLLKWVREEFNLTDEQTNETGFDVELAREDGEAYINGVNVYLNFLFFCNFTRYEDAGWHETLENPLKSWITEANKTQQKQFLTAIEHQTQVSD